MGDPAGGLFEGVLDFGNLWRFLGLTLLAFSLPVFVMRLGKEFLVALLPIYLITANVFAESFFIPFMVLGNPILMSLALPVYAGCFVITDLLSEFYGKNDARNAVWLGFVGQVAFLVTLWLVINAPILNADAYQATFDLLPRLVVGSFIAYISSNLLDICIFHAIRNRTGRSRLWLRNNVSTFVSQGVDSLIFLFIAFWRVEPIETTEKFWWFFVAVWIFKAAVAGLDTVALYAARRMYQR